MTIRIVPYVEPLSPASDAQRAVIIESDAFRQVSMDLQMYVEGQILGRSFLVAGHRGAGKTTMLRQAVQEVDARIRNKGETSAQWVRPLFIPLHGPDLLSASRRSEQAQPIGDSALETKQIEPNGDAKPHSAAPPPPPPADEIRHFLDRITSGLYYCAAQEFARRFREQAARVPAESQQRAELLELAADLQVQLDRLPDLDRLRDYWRRVDALDRGVLFERARTAGRGLDEVTALFSVSRVMRPFAGTVDSRQDTETKRSREGSVSLVTIDGQNLLPPLIGLATGVAVWVGLPQASAVMVRAASALLTGLGAVLALKVSSLRSRSTSQTWRETFIPKDDPGSLYRVLPGLIERFQRVGLFPVFVVDELDKVPGLGDKINALLGYMKQFVTERAFFCFVTNRSFYQQAIAQAEASAYSTLHTRFGDSVFVRYHPEDFHRYLDGVLKVDTSSTDPSQAKTAEAAMATLRYVLLSRSYLHPYDLRRELARWQDAGGMVNWKDDDLVNSERLQREVAAQVAVEVVYRGVALREYIRDPSLAQTVLDALYFPILAWRRGSSEVELTQEALTLYLVARTGIEEEVAAGAKPIAPDQLVPDALQTTLLAETERMMRLLCKPVDLVTEASAVNIKLGDAISAMLSTLQPLADEVTA